VGVAILPLKTGKVVTWQPVRSILKTGPCDLIGTLYSAQTAALSRKLVGLDRTSLATLVQKTMTSMEFSYI